MDQRKDQPLKWQCARYMALNDYKLGSWWASGIRELYADCHHGLALADRSRTWSLMQLERAQRTQPGFAWRINHGAIETHVEKVKEVYYEVWRQLAELGRQGMSEADALRLVLTDLSRNPNWRREGKLQKTVPQIWASIVSKPGRETNTEYERRVFGW
ncbi:hypothetical protein WJX73_004882 [Symbiochloris irregularis]|uniref:Uncharacterized protein n=1 Tax=Symbiochloris irregularis TaxID=706552 RepID=A0AAW1Q3T8_9CHLO